jgi:hypothetical protein
MNRSALFLLLATVFGLSPGWCFAQQKASDSGLMAYLPLRVDMADHSPANVPVKTNGTVVLRDGGAYFDGKDTSSLELPHLHFANRPFAVSMWIKVTGKNPMYGLIQQEETNTWNRWLHIMLRGGRQPYLGFLMNDAISPEQIPAWAWAHLVFMYTGVRQELWINGRLLCARKCEAYEGANGVTLIGRSPDWSNVPTRNFEGYMREIRIYGRSLSVSEIVTLYNRDNGSPAAVKLASANSAVQNPDPPLSDALAAEVGIPFLEIDGGKLIITAESGQIYEVQATSDLNRPWQFLTTLTNQNGVVEYNDPDAPKSTQRFYRVKTK